MAKQINPRLDGEDDTQKQTPSNQSSQNSDAELEEQIAAEFGGSQTPGREFDNSKDVGTDVTIPRSLLDDILKRLQRVENDTNAPVGQTIPGTGIGPYGRTTGIETMFPVDPKQYFDPTERLSKEQWLTPFGFQDNFMLGWKVVPIRYETKFGTYRQEPRFEITLYQLQRGDDMLPVMDDNGNPMLIIRKRGYFFEDREEAEAAAYDAGMQAPNGETYEQLRYERFARWLRDVFYPPKRQDISIQPKETVIDGQVVQLVSSEAAGVRSRVVELSGDKAVAAAERMKTETRAAQMRAGLKPTI